MTEAAIGGLIISVSDVRDAMNPQISDFSTFYSDFAVDKAT